MVVRLSVGRKLVLVQVERCFVFAASAHQELLQTTRGHHFQSIAQFRVGETL